jgi:enoyl-CoA hydratase
VADRIAANGPLAVQGIKRAVQETEALPEEKALPIEFEIGMRVRCSEDAVEGPLAFLQKRTPHYKGR